MRIISPAFVIAVIFTLAACGSKDKKAADTKAATPAKQPPLIVEALVVHPQELKNDIEVSGSLLPG